MKTYRDLVAFLNAAQPWLLAHPEDRKFRYALKKVTKQGEKLWATYTEQAEDLDIEHCATGKDGVIVKDERGQVAFTKEGLRKRNAARKALFETDAGVVPFLAAEVPPELTESEREAFAGFVLPDEREVEEPI
jgi:hypothetical protein